MAEGLLQRGKLVAAIDFGTSTSGIAFSLHTDYMKNRLNIAGANFDDVKNLQTAKVPTAVLFDKAKTFHSFGQEAQDKFRDLCRQNQDEAKKWFYFHRFKMVLFEKSDLTLSTELQDYWRTNTMPAIEVFAAAIRHLKARMLSRLSRLKLKEEEIDWVLTIPAIWNDKAKQFMREAAIKAGIPTQQLMLALEPEAATVYCRVLSEENRLHGKPLAFDITPSSTGKRFMVLDCGGGTVDVTVHEVSDAAGGTLRELYPPSGGNWGGTKVDEAFEDFLYDILGFDNMAAVNHAEVIEMEQAFEAAKRTFRSGHRVTIKIPTSAQVFFEHADYTEYPNVKMHAGKLSLDSQTFVGFFKPQVDEIVAHVKSVLSSPTVRGITALLMVGGFTQCSLMQAAMQKALGNDVSIFFPEMPTLSILLGAVLFLHEPNIIGWRSSAYTYGIKTASSFEEGVHDEKFKFTVDGRDMCNNVFTKFVTRGDIVPVGEHTAPHSIYPSHKEQKQTKITLYATHEQRPLYVTDKGCKQVGAFLVRHKNRMKDERKREIEVCMVIGGIEMTVMAKDRTSGEVFETRIDFLAE